MGLDDVKRTTCPQCGQLVPSGNSYCGKCGASMSRSPRSSGIEPTSSSPSIRRPRPQYPHYDRKLSLLGRITKLLTSPEEAMEDISLAPDYGGVIVLFIAWTIISIISFNIALQKIQFVGPYGDDVNRMVAAGAAGVVMLIPVVLIIRWLIKSYLIRHACDSKSWNFETAASVTGYAYLPNIIFSIIGLFTVWLLIPSVVIDTVDIDLALAQMDIFTAQTMWITVGLSTLFSLLALFWKSHIGSYGAYFGTHKNCEKGSAFGSFLMIGFLGFIIDFISNFI
ncbi:hypothetical protein E4H12_13360 [Candidatus Thorarchaeota archaeon]|nr:MAG: hypothetical protein E4H12_13360 [Candidatus Thorarchaeota archaeon]